MAESLPDFRGPVVLFDGHCNLCNRSVQFLLKIDRKAILRFAPIQGTFARSIRLDELSPSADPESIILLHNGYLYTHSEAVLNICALMGGGWHLLTVLRIIPRSFRDAAYRMVARNRYRWFGKRESCMVPTAEQQARFMD